MEKDPLLKVRGLAVHYGPVEAVRGIDLEVYQGEIVVLLGANGAGKSTTLNGIVGLAPKAAGSVMYNNSDITDLPTESLVRHGLTLTPEGRCLFSGLTVEENLVMGGYRLGRNSKEYGENLNSMYELFPLLYERRQQLAGTLSGGQQQQLAIARSMMSSPGLLLLDEPSLGLAPQVIETIFELIAELSRKSTTVLLVEQNASISLEIADRGYVLSSGRIITEGTADELSSSDIIEQAYLGSVE